MGCIFKKYFVLRVHNAFLCNICYYILYMLPHWFWMEFLVWIVCWYEQHDMITTVYWGLYNHFTGLNFHIKIPVTNHTNTVHLPYNLTVKSFYPKLQHQCKDSYHSDEVSIHTSFSEYSDFATISNSLLVSAWNSSFSDEPININFNMFAAFNTSQIKAWKLSICSKLFCTFRISYHSITAKEPFHNSISLNSTLH
jgi:hypothetical protein